MHLCSGFGQSFEPILFCLNLLYIYTVYTIFIVILDLEYQSKSIGRSQASGIYLKAPALSYLVNHSSTSTRMILIECLGLEGQCLSGHPEVTEVTEVTEAD